VADGVDCAQHRVPAMVVEAEAVVQRRVAAPQSN